MKGYQWPAHTETTVAPDLVDRQIYGQHRSIVKKGVRHWWFEREGGRDQFLNAVANGFFQRPSINKKVKS